MMPSEARTATARATETRLLLHSMQSFPNLVREVLPTNQDLRKWYELHWRRGAKETMASDSWRGTLASNAGGDSKTRYRLLDLRGELAVYHANGGRTEQFFL
jgi:hypothetical protein